MKFYQKIDKENTIIWIDVPIVYRGLKINVGGLMNGKDIYNVEIMPVQIKGVEEDYLMLNYRFVVISVKVSVKKLNQNR